MDIKEFKKLYTKHAVYELTDRELERIYNEHVLNRGWDFDKEIADLGEEEGFIFYIEGFGPFDDKELKQYLDENAYQTVEQLAEDTLVIYPEKEDDTYLIDYRCF